MTQQTLSLKKIYSGKVRDLYEIDDKRMLMVATDRLSAFDVILDDPIPRKGEILTQISNFWFNQLAHIMPNHFTGDSVYDVLPKEEADLVKDRAVVCKRLSPIKIESIVRGYLTGSGLKDYQQTGTICGLKLPKGLVEASKLPEPIFTPSSKEEVGNHDINISYEECEKLIGVDLAAQVKEKAIALYTAAAEYALTKGIIICDTKFEFGLDEKGTLTLMDEVLTPDSSRFWSVDTYQEGTNPPSFDKQFVRDWLENSGWNKQPPAPRVPSDVIEKTVAKYQEALDLLTQ
ncbi:phosphoribosylaminoimidazolesuccinocarboxamide synthase [Rodentibacter pneumotropicus]|uniref:phosphoribosylaminoimidazolesuccinocarboxamide synthase n=1 Tax=Rodentibacter pneumotropicus TaxID=758 RepID=UPI0009897116|nr:phosphoribosylaminoimidazolesuccinocarboxamide synthase [Rodentibacter pneumotropicus]NBH76113.1 phosphoribosylaminoimidazolesuccinocarboxamide synthase [Rodentibacter pneumotropicus]OOF64964.1 phosphoribosylaminoimidazolesuccinocarboxamide synthase [Rodentibacter pneumotropicus]THA03663.1 phosphoribosylaminoimidazolesuccinocarboxamide synthase [Rodentibacter pneumotropicus]THA03790.1 phosphoribosylaminoimidazolesuccinocarboxamide synthase [Rodentibacter pneumotropicus]THA14037.1 phosphorib